MIPKLCAFDLDGTLLTTDKRLSAANREALLDMTRHGVRVALASGRLGSSMMQVVADMDIEPAMLTLNGAAVYNGLVDADHLVYAAPLTGRYAQELVAFAQGQDFAINYYIDGGLYTVLNDKTRPWVDLYYRQTRTSCVHLDNLSQFNDSVPCKIIFVGDEHRLDEIENSFRARWDGQVYICRTWNYYLEFLSLDANKGKGLTALAKACGATMEEVVAFGDAENDIPMLSACGMGIAMKNATDETKQAARHVSQWTNDEDGVAHEWERIKKL